MEKLSEVIHTHTNDREAEKEIIYIYIYIVIQLYNYIYLYIVIQLYSDTYLYAVTIRKVKRIQNCDYLEKLGGDDSERALQRIPKLLKLTYFLGSTCTYVFTLLISIKLNIYYVHIFCTYEFF